jgi:hypothetical protein
MKGKRARRAISRPSPFDCSYNTPVSWEKMREELAKAVEARRDGKPRDPHRMWEARYAAQPRRVAAFAREGCGCCRTRKGASRTGHPAVPDRAVVAEET